jgi:hypothetical protein
MLQIYSKKRDTPNLLTIIKKKENLPGKKNPKPSDKNPNAPDKNPSASDFFPKRSNFIGRITCG